jgi:hypothetical protein
MRADPAWRAWLTVNSVDVTSIEVVPGSPIVVTPPRPQPPPVPAPPAPPTLQDLEQRRVDDLILVVQDQIELDPRLGGVLIRDARIIEPEGKGERQLQVSGKVVKNLIMQTVEVAPAWASLRPIAVDLSGIVPTPLAQSFAARYYSLGLEYFRKGDYATADRAFMKSLSEAPHLDTLRYWRVITAIALGQTDRAKQRLIPLLRKNPLGAEGPVIAAEFEKVQGPLRWKLMELEKQVLLEDLP